MQINSLKLTIQDVHTADHVRIAGVFGTLFLDVGEYKMGPDDEPMLDEAGEKIPIYETIEFTFALEENADFKKCIKDIILQATTLKNLKIAKENGTVSHFLEAMGVPVTPKVVKRVSKTRKK